MPVGAPDILIRLTPVALLVVNAVEVASTVLPKPVKVLIVMGCELRNAVYFLNQLRILMWIDS